MKKFLSLILMVILLISIVPVAFASDDVKVTLNGQYIEFDQSPIIIDSRTFVPIRAVCEALGADVYWNESVEGVLIVKNAIKLFIIIDQREFVKLTVKSFEEFIVNADNLVFEEITLDVPPQIVGDRTLLPIRAICEALGATVDWNEEIKTVKIECSDTIIYDKNQDKTFFDSYIKSYEAPDQELLEMKKKIYKDYDYVTTISITGFPDFESYIVARDFIDARVGAVEYIRGFYTMDLSQENRIVIVFGYNEGFDIDGFVSSLTAEAEVYFADAENNVILDKANIVDAKSVWNGQSQKFDIELSLTSEGRKKFAVATEEIAKRTDGNNTISIFFDGSIISAPRVMDKIDSDKVRITGDFKYALPSSIAYLIKAKAAPENLKVELNIEQNKN